MKRVQRIVAIVSAVAIGIAAIPCMGVFAADTADSVCDILVLGDSISTGYGLAEGEYAFDAYLEDCTADKDVTNLAVNGATTTDLLAKLTESTTIAQVQASDVICISIGGNDLLQVTTTYFSSLMEEGESYYDFIVRLAGDEEMLNDAKTYLTVKNYSACTKAVANYAELVSQLTVLNPDAQLLFQTIYNPVNPTTTSYNGTDYSQTFKELRNFYGSSLEKLNAAMTAQADANTNVTLVDVAAVFDASAPVFTRIDSKDVHPSAIGQATIATLLLNAMDGAVITGKSAKFEAILQDMSDEIKTTLGTVLLTQMEALAAEMVNVSLTASTTAAPAQTITLEMKNDAVGSGTFVLTMDEQFEVSACDSNADWGDVQASWSYNSGKLVYNWSNTGDTTSTDVPFLTITLSVPSDAVNGTYTIGFVPEESIVYDTDGLTLPVSYNDGTVTIVGGEEPATVRGDVTGDGVVNTADAVAVLKEDAAVMAYNPSTLTEAQQAIADVNGDGKINSVDAVVLLKYDAVSGTRPDATPEEIWALIGY